MSNEIAEQPAAPVPDLVHSGATEITSEDVALPRIKFGQHMSEHVQEGRVPYGSIFQELGSDDPDPKVLVKDGEKEPLRFYVLGGPIKGWSYSRQGEPLQTWQWDDPERHPDAWRTYKYVVAIPAHDTDLPSTLLLTRTSTGAARQLNTILAKAAQYGPTDEVPFELSLKRDKNDKGAYVVARVTRAEVAEKDLAKDLEAIKDLKDLASQGAATPPASAREPVEQPAI